MEEDSPKKQLACLISSLRRDYRWDQNGQAKIKIRIVGG
jgi:hypothetical protein